MLLQYQVTVSHHHAHSAVADAAPVKKDVVAAGATFWQDNCTAERDVLSKGGAPCHANYKEAIKLGLCISSHAVQVRLELTAEHSHPHFSVVLLPLSYPLVAAGCAGTNSTWFTATAQKAPGAQLKLGCICLLTFQYTSRHRAPDTALAGLLGPT